MSNGGEQPSVLRFSKLLRHLVRKGNSRGTIQLVERWLEHGHVSQTARLAQARALMDLRLMDRAWVRLREAAQADPTSVVVQLMMADMFIERGWPTKALPILERIDLMELDEDERQWWSTLRTSASLPPRGPPDDASETERIGTAEEVLRLAESYISVGSFVRAESLLERLLRDGFASPRVHDLLWGIQGDFSSAQATTPELLAALSTTVESAEWVAFERTDSLIAADTAHVDPALTAASSLAEATRRAFPRLFRRDENTGETTAGTAGEVTMSSVSVAEDDGMFSGGATDPESTPYPGAGDTRIMQVISRGDGVAVHPVDGAIHRTVGDRNKVDLKAHREAYLPPEDETFLEDEDKDLIVMTRREDRPPPPADKPRPSPPVPERSERTDPAVPPPAAPLGPSPEVADAPQDSRRPWLTAAGVLVITAALAWMVFAVLHWIAQEQIIEDAHRVVAAADFRAMQEMEARLEAQIEADRSPVAVRMVELALVRTILWSDYTGDPGRMTAVQIELDRARELGAPSHEVALASGYLALAMGDLPSAELALSRLDLNDPLCRDLTARVALQLRDDQDSRDLLNGLGPATAEAPLLELLSREALLTALDEFDRIEALRAFLLTRHGNNPFVQIQRFQEQWDEAEPLDVLMALDDVMESLPGPVSGRQEGRLHALRASLLMERGEYDAAERSWASALVVDPANPRYLHHAAGVRLADNQVTAALDDLDRCLESRPWDQSCRHGKIQALLELDRVEDARQSIDAWGAERTMVFRAWVHRAAGNPDEAIATLEGEDGALAAWVRGMALLDLGSPKAGVALEPAIEGWGAVSQPMTRILVSRARVAQSIATGDLDAMAAALNTWAANDPVAMAMVAQRMDEAGQRVSAEQLFEQAVEIGPESAVALHALGLFWFDPRASLESARSVWRRYLDLQPSGDRARRTRARMGRR
ncbi:MAG: hypothetical protein VX944_10470 [Myxococcota bacterium]|nr:hypothetical protein [Myxococcota bacterium]